ncbi:MULTISPECIES: hypothetical protein [unclassified Flavobacterium]|uniref:hypothetical protein n=1 Tax=unclassified Flavobacterium TaxID=196869 RepID=UPI0012AA73AB|nr:MULTISPECIES: hypothetical protein [unclassified Flavobacterium]MBF4485486.1 hypothetical protein [Flavobacterium sp. CSZ]QGK74445.1 hypothetical protein GIY83_10375 [Flavobacterium sp. SLB02]
MKIRKLQLLLLLFISVTIKSVAAPFPPQPRSIPPPVGDPVPINSEISILFVSGVLLGIFFLLKRPKLISKSFIEKSDQS